MTTPQATAEAAPADVDPVSGFRLPLPARDGLPPAARALYDRLVDPQGGTIAGLRGPAGIQLHSPKLAEYSTPLNRYLRWEAGFDGRIRELAILVTARELDSQFEWTAHEPVAQAEGLEPAVIEIVKRRLPTAGLAERDAVVVDLGREAFGDRKVAPETFARALRQFGAQGLVDLTALMGNYAATALLLVVFDMQLKPDQEPLLP